MVGSKRSDRFPVKVKRKPSWVRNVQLLEADGVLRWRKSPLLYRMRAFRACLLFWLHDTRRRCCRHSLLLLVRRRYLKCFRSKPSRLRTLDVGVVAVKTHLHEIGQRSSVGDDDAKKLFVPARHNKTAINLIQDSTAPWNAPVSTFLHSWSYAFSDCR